MKNKNIKYLNNCKPALAQIFLELVALPVGLDLLLLEGARPAHQVLGLTLHLADKQARHRELFFNLPILDRYQR